MQDPPHVLAQKLEAYALETPGSASSFSERLARESGWSQSYATRVVREYRRFLLLVATRGTLTVPSEHVDRAWHQHILSSARYRAFCRDLFGRPLDHQPNEGAPGERRRLLDAYEGTLVSYRQCFGEPAPSDIWPSVARRWGAKPCVRSVKNVEHWLLHKPRAWQWFRGRRRPWAQRALFALSALVILGCGDIGLTTDLENPDFISGFFWLWLSTLAVGWGIKAFARHLPLVDPVKLEPYELAQLAGGPRVAVESAVTSLIARGALAFDLAQGKLQRLGPLPEGCHALEAAVYDEQDRLPGAALRELWRREDQLCAELAERLEQLELTASRSFRLPLYVALIAPFWAAVRLLSQVGTDGQSLWGLLYVVPATIVSFVVCFPRPDRTLGGEQLLEKARALHEPLRHGTPANELASAGTLPIALSLFGLAAVPIAGAADWTTELALRGKCGDLLRQGPGEGEGGGGCGGGSGCGG